MTAADLIASVRASCGRVANTIDILDTDITREGEYVLGKIAAAIPERVVRKITTEKGVHEYSVHENSVRIEATYRLPEGSETMTERVWPSIQVIDALKRRRSLEPVRFNFHPVRRKLILAETPEEDGENIFYISIEEAVWTLADVPRSFDDLVAVGVTWRTLEIIALRRSTEGGILREGGRVDYPADALRKFIDAKKKEFEAGLADAARRNFGAY